MQSSKYLERFRSLSPEAYELVGDCLLVEKIPIAERKTKSGLILEAGRGERARETTSSDVPTFVHVVAVGKGYYDDETKQDVPLNVSVGDIILIGAHSVRWFSDMDISDYQAYEIGLTREQEIKLRFSGQAAYERAFADLSKSPEEKVEERQGCDHHTDVCLTCAGRKQGF